MKIILPLAAALGLAACAGITERTGLTSEDQMCIANTLVALQSDPAAKDLRPKQKAALVAAACEIDLDELLLSE